MANTKRTFRVPKTPPCIIAHNGNHEAKGTTVGNWIRNQRRGGNVKSMMKGGNCITVSFPPFFVVLLWVSLFLLLLPLLPLESPRLRKLVSSDW